MLWSFILSFLLSLISLPIIRKISIKYNIIDKKSSMPYFGGLSIIFSLLLCTPFNIFQKFYIIIFGFLGIYLDLKTINYLIKLLIEALLGYLAASQYLSNPVDLIIAILFFIFIVNSIQNKEGKRKPLSIVFLISSLFLALTISVPFNKYFLLSISGSLIAYVIYNFSIRKVSLGNTGKYAIGSIFGISVISSLSKGYLYFFASIIVLLPYLLDTALGIFRKIIYKKHLAKDEKNNIFDKVFKKVKDRRKAIFLFLIIYLIFSLNGFYFLYNPYTSLVISILFSIFIIYKLELFKYDGDNK
ncbi:hypothetical protein [Thermosipho globiformans]|uniref:hypothetical protein n=1 Tax=Thermosipho globiformans TaxID=380685 RepID=UPI000F8D666B|nr:hypothetical protein [Thermosipho globiformans]